MILQYNMFVTPHIIVVKYKLIIPKSLYMMGMIDLL
jgi:hypothetical protein